MRPKRDSAPSGRFQRLARSLDAKHADYYLPAFRELRRGGAKWWKRQLLRRNARAFRREKYAEGAYPYGEAECLDCDWCYLGYENARKKAHQHRRAFGHQVIGPCRSMSSGHHRWSRHDTFFVDGKPHAQVTADEARAFWAAGRASSHVTSATCMFCGRPHPRPELFDRVHDDQYAEPLRA